MSGTARSIIPRCTFRAAQFGGPDFLRTLVRPALGGLLALTYCIAAVVTIAHAATPSDLSSSNAKQRIEAAESLSQNWRKAMGPVLREISSFKSEIDIISNAKVRDRELYFRALTDTLREMINRGSREAVNLFRETDNHDVIYTLLRAARGSDRGIRINSTIILANVSDNSSVCVAVDELRAGDLDDNGRINLLQIVQTVASYMYKQNWDATKQTLGIVKTNLDRTETKEYERTLNFIKDIDGRLERNQRKNDPLPPRHSACADYKYRN